MKLLDAPWQHWTGMPHLLEALAADEGQTRYVGGCVRDTLLGLPVSDVDLATRLDPRQVTARLGKARNKAVPTGIAHGTVTAVLRDQVVEVTSLRRDVTTDGRRATIAFTEDWREDAARRDFTINAFSVDPVSLQIFDYFDGAADLDARRVRFIGDPRTRIAEDHLRILRFFRFHARFGAGDPDRGSLEACVERANDLMALSRERIADELLKLLSLPDPTATVALMIKRGILRPVLPEIEDASLLRRLVERERMSGIVPDPARRLAALLPPDPALAASLSARLRLPNRMIKRISTAAERVTEGDEEPRALAYRVGTDQAIDRLLLGSEQPEKILAGLAELEGWQPPRLPLGGGDLIAMGLAPGPVVARTLQAIEREWVREGFPEDREAVHAIARRHVDQALRDSQ